MPDQIAHLNAAQAAAQTKFDRCLQELERLGGQRVQPLPQVMDAFDLETLKSVVYDMDEALTRYRYAQKELNRIQR